MIRVDNVVKDYWIHGRPKRVLEGVSFTVERGQKLAVLGRNGAGKSTLIRLIGGLEVPTSGTITRAMRLSWPLAFQGGFQGSLTGDDNVRFISRIYNVPYEETRAYVEEFAELGKEMANPTKTYSAGMRARLAFGLSLAIDFDCYLIDEVLAVGDQSFHRKCQVELFEKRSDRAIILASHAPEAIRQYCTHGLVLKQGRAKVFDDLSLAIDIYSAL